MIHDRNSCLLICLVFALIVLGKTEPAKAMDELDRSNAIQNEMIENDHLDFLRPGPLGATKTLIQDFNEAHYADGNLEDQPCHLQFITQAQQAPIKKDKIDDFISAKAKRQIVIILKVYPQKQTLELLSTPDLDQQLPPALKKKLISIYQPWFQTDEFDNGDQPAYTLVHDLSLVMASDEDMRQDPVKKYYALIKADSEVEHGCARFYPDPGKPYFQTNAMETIGLAFILVIFSYLILVLSNAHIKHANQKLTKKRSK